MPSVGSEAVPQPNKGNVECNYDVTYEIIQILRQ